MRMGLMFAASALLTRNEQALARERAKRADPTDNRNPESPMHREPALVRAKARDPNAPRASMPGSVRRRLAREALAQDRDA